MKTMLLVAFVASLTRVSAGAQQPAPARPASGALSPAELEQMAFQANPALRAAQAGVDGARSRARHGVFVEQTILLGGKLRLNRAVFEHRAEEAESELALQRQRVASSVRAAFYRTLTAERRVDVQERLAVLVAEAVGITAQLFNVGAADRPDFLGSEIEARRVQLALSAARNHAFAVRQQLAAVVGQPDVAARPLSGTLEDTLPVLERDATLRRFLEQSPQMRVARAAVVRAQASTAAARRASFPDLSLRGGALYNREQNEDVRRPRGWEGTFEAGVSLPLFDRNRDGVAARRADEARAAADVQRIELSLRAQLAMAFASYLTAVGESESYRLEIIPKAEEAYRLYLTRYREMAAAYPQVLSAQRMLLELSSRYLDRRDEAWQTSLQIQGFLSGDGLQSQGAVEAPDRDYGGTR